MKHHRQVLGSLRVGVGPVGREAMDLVLETLLPTSGLRSPAQLQLPISQMGKPRPRKEKRFIQGHPSS